MQGEDHFRLLEGSGAMPVPRRTGGLNESGRGIIERSHLAGQPERLELSGKLRPAFETVLAGDDELRVCKMKWRAAQMGMMACDALKRRPGSFCMSAEKVFGLFLILFEIGLIV
jgi:hypothetical protein